MEAGRFKNRFLKHAIERITQFRDEVEAREATLVLSLPWFYGSIDQQTVANVRKTAQSLEGIAPTIYNQENLNIQSDSSLFADTHYHLLPESQKIRSREIVSQIQPLIHSESLSR